jgi:hypothetical protein
MVTSPERIKIDRPAPFHAKAWRAIISSRLEAANLDAEPGKAKRADHPRQGLIARFLKARLAGSATTPIPAFNESRADLEPVAHAILQH